jgi:hypothetical protein
MKRILMSLMVIGLVGGLMGSALADFSDIETSVGNYFESGSLDLLVSDNTGALYEDPDVPAFFNVVAAWPECEKAVVFDLHNDGSGNQTIPWVYIHFKNLECYGIEKTEPELAAEMAATPIGELEDGTAVYATTDGSKEGQPLIGTDYGENCELSKHVDVRIWTTMMSTDGTAAGAFDWAEVDLAQYDVDPQNGVVKMNELVCNQVELGQLANEDDPETVDVEENHMYVKIILRLQDIDEDDYPGVSLFDETIPAEAKWDHWPTNALMLDGMSFDMAFELLQIRFVPET